MATGALDANGIWIYGEDDSETTFSGLLNKLGDSVSDKFTGGLPIASGGTGATTLAGVYDSLYIGMINVVPSSVAKAGASSTATANAQGLVTFSACTSLSLNGVFSTTYSKYQVFLTGVTGSAQQSINLRLRSGTTDSSAGYYSQLLDVNNGAVSGANIQNANDFAAGLANNANPGAAHTTFIVQNPANTVYTNLFMNSFGVAGANYTRINGGYHLNTSAFTGFTLIPTTGTFSGTVQVVAINE